jgi:hypothetical protein
MTMGAKWRDDEAQERARGGGASESETRERAHGGDVGSKFLYIFEYKTVLKLRKERKTQ